MTDSLTFASPGMPIFTEEDPDTNGRILLTWNNGALRVYDVSNKADVKLLSTLTGAEQHTISCVLDCSYAYGSEGKIIDLRNPAAPKEVGNWRTGLPRATTSTHDVTEYAPGRLLTSSQPMYFLDAHRGPAHPAVSGSGGHPEVQRRDPQRTR